MTEAIKAGTILIEAGALMAEPLRFESEPDFGLLESGGMSRERRVH